MSAQAPRTRWGGIADGCFPADHFFRITEDNGVYWFVDPDGGRFLSKGVNTVSFDQDAIRDSQRIPYAESCTRKYGGKHAWRSAIAVRLVHWGFNTLGSWSDEMVAQTDLAFMAVACNLDLGMSFARAQNDTAKRGTPPQVFPDVFDAGFDRHIRLRARELCATHLNEQSVLGWFIDNELRWGADWRGPEELLMLHLARGPETAGGAAAMAWLRDRHPDFTTLKAVWRIPAQSWDAVERLTHIDQPYSREPAYQRNPSEEEAANRADPKRAVFFADCDEFAAYVADRYFSRTITAIKAADPNHLILGCRFAYAPPPGVVAAAARYCDVISLNCYDRDPSPVIDAYSVSGRPCLIGEFSFRAADSGLPNTAGAGPLVTTQTERAALFRHYVTAALKKPQIVGFHWFEHADQPAEGRFDGENSNFGTVSINDDIYKELTDAMTSVNAGAEMLHATAGHVA